MKANETFVELRVMEFLCPPEEISAILQINPTSTWLKGDYFGAKKVQQHKENGWELRGNLSTEATLTEWIDNVLNLIEPYKDNFKKLPEGVYVELSCCVYIYGDEPAINLSRENIKLLAEINAAYDLDYYILQKLEEDE